MKVLVDTGPLLAALDRRDPAYEMAGAAMKKLRRDAIVPSPVVVEVDHLARKRVGLDSARRFLKHIAGGSHQVAYPTAGLMQRAVELDRKYSDLNLGVVDGCVMAIAERHELPIFTFDFRDFRATESASGPWRLAIDEDVYRRSVEQ
ncbi:MAG: PIN domain-containing protein [Solirubrobacterales bacterium]